MKKLYVGNLPHSYSEEDLKELFSQFSSVISAKLIIDRDTGRSKGFGFVEFESGDEADEAISEMHGKDAGGRALVVNEARPQVKRENTRPFNSNNNNRRR
jgi:cold-inducible RNA-binding protein